jgi:hypothetical protein
MSGVIDAWGAIDEIKAEKEPNIYQVAPGSRLRCGFAALGEAIVTG